jgi:hypothetical protein
MKAEARLLRNVSGAMETTMKDAGRKNAEFGEQNAEWVWRRKDRGLRGRRRVGSEGSGVDKATG